jgi:hypothetical protein
VDDRDPVPHLRRPPLHSELQHMTGRCCPACDAAGTGSKPFPSLKELRTHVERVHHKRLCDVCAHVSNSGLQQLLHDHAVALQCQQRRAACKVFGIAV